MTSVVAQLLIEFLIILKIEFNSDFRWSILNTNVDGFNNLGVIKIALQLMCHDFPRSVNHINLTKISGKLTRTLLEYLHIALLQTSRWSRAQVNKVLSSCAWLKLILWLLRYKSFYFSSVSQSLFWATFRCTWHFC